MLARVTLAADLELPAFDHTNAELRGDRYRAAMAELEGHDGWLASSPFDYIVLGTITVTVTLGVVLVTLVPDLPGVVPDPRFVVEVPGVVVPGR